MKRFFTDTGSSPPIVGTADVAVRLASAADLPGCGRLASRGDGSDPRRHASHLERRVEAGAVLFVAESEGRVWGFATVEHRTPIAGGGHGAPDGWYLSGVLVDAVLARRGVGRRLVEAQLDWTWDRADEVFYAMASTHRISHELHTALGFVEISRDFSVPGLLFADGQGVLYRCRRTGGEVLQLDAHRAARAAAAGGR